MEDLECECDSKITNLKKKYEHKQILTQQYDENKITNLKQEHDNEIKVLKQEHIGQINNLK